MQSLIISMHLEPLWIVVKLSAVFFSLLSRCWCWWSAIVADKCDVTVVGRWALTHVHIYLRVIGRQWDRRSRWSLRYRGIFTASLVLQHQSSVDHLRLSSSWRSLTRTESSQRNASNIWSRSSALTQRKAFIRLATGSSVRRRLGLASIFKAWYHLDAYKLHRKELTSSVVQLTLTLSHRRTISWLFSLSLYKLHASNRWLARYSRNATALSLLGCRFHLHHGPTVVYGWSWALSLMFSGSSSPVKSIYTTNRLGVDAMTAQSRVFTSCTRVESGISAW